MGRHPMIFNLFLGLGRALGTRFYIGLFMKQFVLEFLKGWYLRLGLRLILSGSKCFVGSKQASGKHPKKRELKNSNCEVVDFFSMSLTYLFDPWFCSNFLVYDESSQLLQYKEDEGVSKQQLKGWMTGNGVTELQHVSSCQMTNHEGSFPKEGRVSGDFPLISGFFSCVKCDTWISQKHGESRWACTLKWI